MPEPLKTEQKSSDLDMESMQPNISNALGTVSDTPHKMTIQHDAVFGDITEGGPNYRNVGWIGTTALMMKTQIGLGVLSMPVVFGTFGIIPGNIVLVIVAAVTTWSNYMVGVFKLNHPEVYGIDDVGRMLFGRIGYEIFGAVYCLNFTMVSGSAMISISVALNALSEHGACTAVFVAVAAIMCFILSSIRTLARISALAWIGTACIITSVFIVAIAVSLQERPTAAPATGTWVSDYKLVNRPSFTEAMSAVSTLIFTYAGTAAFFNLVAEMREPRLYTRALSACQVSVTAVYIVVGTLVYYFCGSYVETPAPGSAGPLIKKVAYGIALPGLMVSCVLLAHLPAKHIFVRILRGSKHLTSNTLTHWATWLSSTFAVSLSAYLIASGIPNFGSLVALVGASLSTLLTLQPYGGMWFYDNWRMRGESPTVRWWVMAAWSTFMIVGGTFVMISGTYGAIMGIIESFREQGGSPAWSCRDNSGST